MGGSYVLEIDGNGFNEKVIGGSKNIKIVKFWAEWCGPCRSFKPIVEGVAQQLSESKDSVEFYSANTDDPSMTSINEKYAIRGIPACLAFKDGNIIDTKVGSLSTNAFIEWVKSLSSK